MTFVQATTGSGGWPMSVWLTPELKPFYGGTYFPPASTMGPARASSTSCSEIARVWQAERGKVDAVGRGADRAAASRWRRRRRRPTVPGVGGARADASQQFRERVRPAPRRLRRRAEVSAAVASCCSCCASTRAPATPHAARDGAAHAARDGARRHARSHRRRLSSLLGRRRLARAALREDALRPGAARARVSSRPRRRPAIRSSPRWPRTRCATCMREMTDAGRRLLLRRGRRQRPAGARRRRRRAHKTEGAFYLWRADEVDALLGADAPIVKRAVRHRAGRQRAAAIRSRSSPARTCCTSRGRSTTSRRTTGQSPDDVVDVAAARAADDVRGAARRGRGRTSTTRS